MCTTTQRDEIIAEILVAHTKMPRRYAAWFVARLNPIERTFVTRAAIAGRRSLVREVQQTVHRRQAADPCFPENIGRSRAAGTPRRRRGSRLHADRTPITAHRSPITQTTLWPLEEARHGTRPRHR